MRSIWTAPAACVSADGSALVGRPVPLLSNTRAWQGNLIEAPEMVQHARGYTLFYSANDYASANYGIGYATCRDRPEQDDIGRG